MGGFNKSRNNAQIEGVIEFLDHQVHFRTTLSTSLTIEEIKRNIIQNWWLREKHSNPNFEGSVDCFEFICQKSSIDLAGYICRDTRQTLARFAQTSDLNFDHLEVKILNKLNAATMGVRLSARSNAKISNFLIEQPNHPDEFDDSTVITQTSFRGPARAFPSGANLMNDLGKKVAPPSSASTAPGTKDKNGPVFGEALGPRKDFPRIFTESVPKMAMDAGARSYLCNALPKLRKGTFQTEPPMERLHGMSLDELKHLESFKIWNDFGRIEFSEPVDLTDVDLDEAVVITHGIVDVYPPDRFEEESRPECGSKINRPAIVTLYNVQDGDKGVPFHACLEHLDSLGVQQEAWDPATGTLVVYLPYGF